MNKFFATLAVVGACASLGACAETQFAGYSSAPMAQNAEFQHPDFNGGVEPPEAHAQIVRLSGVCNRQGHPQLAGPIQAGVTGAVPGALVTAGELYADATLFDYSAAAKTLYKKEGAINGGISGGYGNVNSAAQSSASAIGGCTRDLWNVSKSYEPDKGKTSFTDRKYKGTVVETVLDGKSLNAVPPALRKNYSSAEHQ